MNFPTFSKNAGFIVLLVLIGFSSCKKDSTNGNSGTNGAITLADSSTAADMAYNDLLSNAFLGVSSNASVFGVSAIQSGNTTTLSTETTGTGQLGCMIYSIDDSTQDQYPKTLTVDFGTGCTGLDGINRTGKLIYVFSGNIFKTGSSISVTSDQFTVNGYGLQGTYTITNLTTAGSGLSFSTVVTNGKITYPGGATYTHTQDKTYTETSGMNTPFDISDDVYSLSGTSSFGDSNGNSLVFTASASAPLYLALNCHYITKGVVSFVYNGSVNGTIDFGDGTCDNSAVINIGDLHQNITLR